MNPKDILGQPIITEKSMAQAGLGEYSFVVDRRATKNQIKEAVEKLFPVHVEGMRTITLKGKTKRAGKKRLVIRLPTRKKAIIRLAKGEKIEYFETAGSAKEAK
jgi:large subunit ribosomal protein L23